LLLVSDINFSQGSVATYYRCGGIFSYHFTPNLLLNQPVKEFEKSVKIWQSYRHEFGGLLIWNTLLAWSQSIRGVHGTCASFTTMVRSITGRITTLAMQIFLIQGIFHTVTHIAVLRAIFFILMTTSASYRNPTMQINTRQCYPIRCTITSFLEFSCYMHFPSPKWWLKLFLVVVLTTYFDFLHRVSY